MANTPKKFDFRQDKGLDNTLSYLHYSVDDIVNLVGEFNYNRDCERNKVAERHLPIAFAPVFHNHIRLFQNIPYQNIFIKEFKYSAKHDANRDLSNEDNLYTKGVLARIKSRAYPSLVREVHYAKYLEEMLPEQYEVYYNEYLDYEYGIDILVFDPVDVQYYAICLSINSDSSNYHEERKEQRRKEVKNLKYEKIKINIDYSRRNIQLYEDTNIDNTIARIISRQFGEE